MSDGAFDKHADSFASVGAMTLPRPSGQVPDKGDKVQLANLRRRPWLNGVSGQVVSNGVDEHGFVVLRLPSAAPVSPSMSERPSPEYKKVHKSRLEPLWPSAVSVGMRKSLSSPDFRPFEESLRQHQPTSLGSTSCGSGGLGRLPWSNVNSDPSGERLHGIESIATVACPLMLSAAPLSPTSTMRSTMSTFCTARKKDFVRRKDPDMGSLGLLARGSQNNPACAAHLGA